MRTFPGLLLTAHSSDVPSGVLSPGTALPTRSSSAKVMMVSSIPAQTSEGLQAIMAAGPSLPNLVAASKTCVPSQGSELPPKQELENILHKAHKKLPANPPWPSERTVTLS